jgi:hypothetical protein
MRYYSSKKAFYRELAVKWSRWAATTELTMSEKLGIAKFFNPIAKRFGLVNEFKDMGII